MANEKPRCRRACWCGAKHLEPFSADYQRCAACGTLVSQVGLQNEGYVVHNDETDFYGKQYWQDHQAQELGLPKIEERVRLDLPERCLYWLRHLLAYKAPPAKVLEIGSAHGAFVGLLHFAGYDATGLELSPWVAEFAKKSFQVPMLVGTIETQALPPCSLDALVANDVMEHLPDPMTTLRRCVELLKPDGVLVIQMPCYPEDKSWQDLVAEQHRFLELTKEPDEHLYLYSKRAARQFFARLGLTELHFETPMFDYDMYFFASAKPLVRSPDEQVFTRLQTTPAARLVLALIDLAREADPIHRLCHALQADRHHHTEAAQKLAEQLQISETDRAKRLQEIHDLARQLHELHQQVRLRDAEWAAHLVHFEKLERQVAISAAARRASGQRIANFRETFTASILLMEQTIQEQHKTIETQQKALVFFRASCLWPRREPGRWRQLPKKLLKMIFPASWRHALRKHLQQPTQGNRPACQ
jgi:SAM-dependent methyltransferase